MTVESEYMLIVLVVFFFKQKTAYEMRISDWSSDVCSSDLPRFSATPEHIAPGCILTRCRCGCRPGTCSRDPMPWPLIGSSIGSFQRSRPGRMQARSEEHTSELQSLMRISYAVFCLKKKTQPHSRYTQNK